MSDVPFPRHIYVTRTNPVPHGPANATSVQAGASAALGRRSASLSPLVWKFRCPPRASRGQRPATLVLYSRSPDGDSNYQATKQTWACHLPAQNWPSPREMQEASASPRPRNCERHTQNRCAPSRSQPQIQDICTNCSCPPVLEILQNERGIHLPTLQCPVLTLATD